MQGRGRKSTRYEEGVRRVLVCVRKGEEHNRYQEKDRRAPGVRKAKEGIWCEKGEKGHQV